MPRERNCEFSKSGNLPESITANEAAMDLPCKFTAISHVISAVQISGREIFLLFFFKVYRTTRNRNSLHTYSIFDSEGVQSITEERSRV